VGKNFENRESDNLESGKMSVVGGGGGGKWQAIVNPEKRRESEKKNRESGKKCRLWENIPDFRFRLPTFFSLNF